MRHDDDPGECHPARVPALARRHAAAPVLHITGLVERECALTPAALAGLPRVPYLGTLSCLEGGNVPNTDWRGIPVTAILALAGPLPTARYVHIAAGPFGLPVDLADAAQVLLCDELSGAPLTVERGGPWRLVVPASRYYTSIKWVDRLTVTADRPDDSASRIAAARDRARQR